MRVCGAIRISPGQGVRTVKVPRGTTILGCAVEGETIAILCMNDPQEPLEERYFASSFMGEEVNERLHTMIGFIEIRRQVPIPRGVIVPPGIKPNQMVAEEIGYIFVYEIIPLAVKEES